MGPLSTSSNVERDMHESPDGPSARRNLLWFGVPLLLLLIFATSTVFVQQAWAIDSFQIGIYCLVAVYLIVGIRKGREELAQPWTAWLLYLVPLWGILQIAIHTTASSYETRQAALRWGALAGVFFLSQILGRSYAARQIMLHAFLIYAVFMAALCLLQLFTSEGKILWLIASGYPDVYATFPNKNNFSQFVELAFPVAVWWAMRKGAHSWAYALAAGVLYAAAIGCASRAGATICTAELLILFAAGLASSFRRRARWNWRVIVSTFALVPLLAAVFTFAVGWQRVLNRFHTPDQFVGRREFLQSAIAMARSRPLVGFGLDTFPEVYQRFAVMAIDAYANHAHNDWAEFAADGGIPFMLLLLIPFTAAVPIAIRHPWGAGLIAVMLHACVDFPFPRPAVSAWMFVMLALLYAAHAEDRLHRGPSSGSNRANTPRVLDFKPKNAADDSR